MKVIRWVLGQIILILDFLTSPKAVVREAEEQRAIDDVTASMSMYQFKTCPFCVKVRRELKRHALHIELRDAKNDAELKAELVREGGRHKVPCLRIEKPDNSVQWLYESNDIIAYLKNQFNLA
ncbi:glutaredoxin [Candidatus Njordibacter sp. Uisw_056]|jgi:glutaredoxin|uniref:glutaredoxin family protein n=1 Tax=Candidatus Njordibacter sp. Uisw_056 TaxID=3230973 RepID=UPI003D408C67|tara:strand:+ start:192 stop:560 length:369 start_codon:yes stop_codon:yes gene_type:complete